MNLVTLHGQAGTSCGKDQINLKLLQNRGIDYLALGHLHTYSLQKLDETGAFCYSGCLEAVSDTHRYDEQYDTIEEIEVQIFSCWMLRI